MSRIDEPDDVLDIDSDSLAADVAYRAALVSLLRAKAWEDVTRRDADVAADFREPRLVAAAQAATVAESDTNLLAGRFWDTLHTINTANPAAA